jgi:hypothetical protein
MFKSRETTPIDPTHIERQLADALRGQRPVQPETLPVDVADLSSRELLQLAWDRAEDELDQLQDELRRMRQRHQAAERDLLARINTKKRLQRELLERAGDAAPSAGVRAG